VTLHRRFKWWLFLVSAGFFAIGVWMTAVASTQRDHLVAVFVTIVFGLGTLVSLIGPRANTLRIDDAGFSYGSFGWKAHVAWNDITAVTIAPYLGGEWLFFDVRPERVDRTARLNRLVSGSHMGFPAGDYGIDPGDLADLFEAHMAAAKARS